MRRPLKPSSATKPKLSAALALLVIALGCHGKKGDTTPEHTLGTPDAKVDPTLCDTTGKTVVTFDLNHDNKPDMWRIYETVDEGGEKDHASIASTTAAMRTVIRATPPMRAKKAKTISIRPPISFGGWVQPATLEGRDRRLHYT